MTIICNGCGRRFPRHSDLALIEEDDGGFFRGCPDCGTDADLRGVGDDERTIDSIYVRDDSSRRATQYHLSFHVVYTDGRRTDREMRSQGYGYDRYSTLVAEFFNSIPEITEELHVQYVDRTDKPYGLDTDYTLMGGVGIDTLDRVLSPFMDVDSWPGDGDWQSWTRRYRFKHE